MGIALLAVAVACDGVGRDDGTAPSIPIQVERPGDAQTDQGVTPTAASGTAQAQAPTSEPVAEPTPRDRVSMLLTPMPSPTVPPALEGLYGNPVPTPVPQGQLEPEFKEFYRQGERHMIQGKTHADQNDYESADTEFRAAASSFTEAIRIRPRITESYTSRGSAYLELSEWEKAIADFESAMAINHTLVSPFAGRAIAYRMMGMDEKAQENIDAAIFNGIDKNILAQYLDGTVKRLRARP